MCVVFDLNEESALLKILNDGFSCLVSVHACILRIVLSDLGIFRENSDDLKVMSEAYFEVVGIVTGSDLNRTGTELDINIVVCNNGDLTSYERQNEHLADNILITLILGVNSNRGIAQECLRSCCCEIDVSGSVLERISDMPEMTGLFLIFNLCIGDRCKAVRAPVDDALASVDEALVVVLYEYFLNCIRASLIHRETLS